MVVRRYGCFMGVVYFMPPDQRPQQLRQSCVDSCAKDEVEGLRICKCFCVSNYGSSVSTHCLLLCTEFDVRECGEVCCRGYIGARYTDVHWQARRRSQAETRDVACGADTEPESGPGTMLLERRRIEMVALCPKRTRDMNA